MREPHHVTVVSGERADFAGSPIDELLSGLTHREMADVYARSDVLLKLSSVEGMFGPPLEAFHRGATAVTTPVTGHEEYIEHGFNALVCDWDDQRGTARLLDLLAADRRLLHHLRTNARETAKAWPTWEQSSQFMAAALWEIRRRPAPDATAAAARMLAEVRAGVEAHRTHIAERRAYANQVERFERFTKRPGVARVLRQRHRPPVRRAIGAAQRLLKK
jgi:hypothetical protein